MEHASCDDISDVKRARYIEEEKEETERVRIRSRSLVGTVYTHGTPKSITSQSHQTASTLALISSFSSTHCIKSTTLLSGFTSRGRRLIRLHPISLQMCRSH